MAQPATLTGSIGVASQGIDISPILEGLGVDSDNVTVPDLAYRKLLTMQASQADCAETGDRLTRRLCLCWHTPMQQAESVPLLNERQSCSK